MLTREQILQANDLRTMEVEVPEWGGTVRVRTMTARERQKYQGIIADSKGKMPGNFIEQFCQICLVDENDKQLFTGDDLQKLGEKSAVALNRVFEAALELNGNTEKSMENIKGE